MSQLAAIKQLEQVLRYHRSLDVTGQTPLTKQLCFGVLRVYWELGYYLNQLLSKPLKSKDWPVKLACLIGLYQIKYLNLANPVAIDQTVRAIGQTKHRWAKGLVNGVLRNFIRRELNYTGYNHPDWLIKFIQSDWPEDCERIFAQNNQQAPLHIRVNLDKISREDYLRQNPIGRAHPSIHSAVTLTKACPVEDIPGFNQGLVSVQDPAAQQAVNLLKPENNHRILDACAAPGGKTGHLLETAAQCDLISIDIDAARCEKIEANLSRLKFKAKLIIADVSDLDAWWDGECFDKILCDAPCSGTGVIRRHPDIKHLRQPEDIPKFAAQQLDLLTRLFLTCKPGGMLLYTTCSILKIENHQVIDQFLATTPGVQLVFEQQVLPGEQDMDGFYYALLQKT